MQGDEPPPSLRGAPASSEQLVGKVIDGRYRLRREMGRGGLCAVFLAEHRYTGRPSALKLLLPEFHDHPEARSRLLAEARMLGAVQHPSVVEVLDAGVADGVPFVVMERLRAKSVEALVAARGKLTIHDALVIARLAATALAATHAAHVVHRDVKPGNLLVVRTPEGKSLKLIDFGVATFWREDVRDSSPPSAVVGTPAYMAPEHLGGRRVTPAADVYSFGATLFECLTGQVPFRGSFEQVYVKAMTAPRPDVRKLRPDVPQELANLVVRALAASPEERFRGGAELLEALVEVEAAMAAKEADGDAASASRRGHVRVPYTAPVELRLPSGEVIEGAIQDISAGGIFLVTNREVPQDGRVVIRFALPAGHMVMGEGRVRWLKSDGTRAAVGLEFSALDPAAKEAIDDYVRHVEPD